MPTLHIHLAFISVTALVPQAWCEAANLDRLRLFPPTRVLAEVKWVTGPQSRVWSDPPDSSKREGANSSVDGLREEPILLYSKSYSSSPEPEEGGSGESAGQ